MRTHQQLDERSLAMHRLVAKRIRENPELFDKARATLGRWRSTVSVGSQPYLKLWDDVMNEGIEACLDLAVENSERATALRQASPFAGILTDEERLTFLRTWNRDHAQN